MMSRGMAAPVLEWRNPVSISCEISVLISMTSPRLGLGRHFDQGAGHQSGSSRQAPSVMTTSTLSDQNEPSDISAIAVTVCVSERRMRVAMAARPGARPKLAR